MVEKLTFDTFKTKIFDFENNDTWLYLSDKPSIIKFGAPWCGPCKAIEPVLEELSREYEGKLNIYSVDVDDENKLAKMFSVSSVPSLLFIPMDGQPEMLVGGLPKEKFNSAIKEVLKVE